MDCCGLDRRRFLGGVVGLAAGGLAFGKKRRIRLAFCSQTLCILPYVMAEKRGMFADQGLSVELIYTRGGGAALQALVGGAVDYAATSLDAQLQAFKNGAPIQRFAASGRLPLFALAVAPKARDRIRSLADLAGQTVGISALGNADHALLLYLLARAGVDATRIRFATLGPNLFEALRVGHVDAGMVQEPALSLLLERGGGVLVNFMDLVETRRYLGGSYAFMGVAVRGDEADDRLDEMRRLAGALQAALEFIHTASGKLIVATLPSELIAGGDRKQLEAIVERYRQSIYPRSTRLDLEAAARVVEAQQLAGLLPENLPWRELFLPKVLEGAAG